TFHFSLFTFHFSLFTFHFSLFTFHFSLFTFHFSLFTFHFSLFTLHSSPITPRPSLFFKQRCTQIAFAEAAHDGDDGLALVLRAGGDLGGSAHVGAGADAAKDAFFLGQAAGPLKRLFIRHQHRLIDDRHM